MPNDRSVRLGTGSNGEPGGLGQCGLWTEGGPDCPSVVSVSKERVCSGRNQRREDSTMGKRWVIWVVAAALLAGCAEESTESTTAGSSDGGDVEIAEGDGTSGEDVTSTDSGDGTESSGGDTLGEEGGEDLPSSCCTVDEDCSAGLVCVAGGGGTGQCSSFPPRASAGPMRSAGLGRSVKAPRFAHATWSASLTSREHVREAMGAVNRIRIVSGEKCARRGCVRNCSARGASRRKLRNGIRLFRGVCLPLRKYLCSG